jgi:FkbM family methyltransferase
LSEFFLFSLDYVIQLFTRRNPRFYHAARRRRFDKNYKKDGIYILKDARLPLLDPERSAMFWAYCIEDTFEAYLNHGDCYEESDMTPYYDLLPEGTYGLRNGLVDVTVEDGDIVLDAGGWIGDFAAYASAKGASAVYAFEPSDSAYEILLKTACLNNSARSVKNIYPVKKGLGDKKAVLSFQSSQDDGGVGSKILSGSGGQSAENSIETTTVDAFVQENGLERVDFIKADIEGYERHMLEGARETLRRFAPKLALCTYHLPDDPEVLERLIREANPAYNVVQKHKKLYASVPRGDSVSAGQAGKREGPL